MNIYRHAVTVLATAIASAVPALSHAEDRIYQGGNWQNPANWSPMGIPGPIDRAIFDTSHTGSVFFAGGFDVESIRFEGGTTGYHLAGENGSIGRTQGIFNFGDISNTITAANLTGRDYFGQDLLVVFGQPTINVPIVDDPNAPVGPLDFTSPRK